ncbi:multi-copy leucine-rich repeat protein, putative [Bodo saltans]|uniref:Multi-copy leucine-rich repeat protein, putative n=1 Tax=Bodo saltans TaxID=75058 RepID=A0A0S4IQP0_BODSA|nr:multi-copy leucine-rich repeat protein, putative [Bodo saltans]|eukprot:CUF17463.1 multi-copy leucine-rich repeat protein, putative [Bodo saltans]
MRCCIPQHLGLTSQRCGMLAVCAGTFRFQTSSNGSPPGDPRHQTSLEPLAMAVTSWLTKVHADKRAPKSGNVFATWDEDQSHLGDMQRYLDGSAPKAPRCGEIPFKLSGSVEHDVLRHVWHREKSYKKSSSSTVGQQRTSLLCNSRFSGTGKTTLLQLTTVKAVRVLGLMVDEHVEAGGVRTSMVARGANDDSEEAKRAHRKRPLGFYVTFNTPVTPSSDDQKYLHTEEFPLLTAIALRMAYSVVPSDNRESYQDFTEKIEPHCDKNSDRNNFNSIIKALRNELDWEGPMFIAIDEFRKPYEGRAYGERRKGLSRMCAFLLDNALPLLPLPMPGHTVYTSYIAVSVYDAVDTVQLATDSDRKLIAQAMPSLSVRDIAQLKNYPESLHDTYLQILDERRKVIGRLRPHQILFLLHMALSTGTPRVMSDCLEGHAQKTLLSAEGDVLTSFHPSEAMLNSMFWNLTTPTMKGNAEITELLCICAAQLVAGFTTIDIFVGEKNWIYRVFALDPGMAEGCTVTDVTSILQHGKEPSMPMSLMKENMPSTQTRVLVSPGFLEVVLDSWPPSGCSSTREHVRALMDILKYHTELAIALVRVGETLVAHGGKIENDSSHLSVCDKLIGKWTNTTRVGFEDLTFDALCLHLSCALEVQNTPNRFLFEALKRVCSKVTDTIDLSTEIMDGKLERVVIPNFPSFFFDAFATKDAELNESDAMSKRLVETLEASAKALNTQYDALQKAVAIMTNQRPRTTIPPSAGNTSFVRLQRALAKGHHFCFQPSNPNNQGENGVVFLRNKSRNKSDRVVSSDEAEWTVLLLQNKFWFRDTQQVKGLQGKKGSQESGNTASENADGEVISVVAKWRDSIGHLPAAVLDTTRKVHTLRYVRILVTANPVEEHHFTPLAMDSDEQAQRIDLLRRANAAFVDSGTAKFDSISALAGKWVDETRAKFKKANAKYQKMKRLKKNQDSGLKPPLKNEHLMAGRRAKELLRHLKQPSKSAVKRGEVIAECRMDLDKITQWCPTVGLFASNIIVIRDLAGDGATDDAQGGK